MQPDPKRIVEHEVISPTIVMVSVRPADGRGSAVMVSHKEAVRFARAILSDPQPGEQLAHG